MSKPHGSEQDLIERNSRWIAFSRIAVVSCFFGVTISIHFGAVKRLPTEYLWASYILISAIYLFSIACLLMPRAICCFRPNIALQSGFDVIFVTGIVLLTGGIDSVYSVLYSLVIIYSTLLMGRRGGLSIAAFCSLSYAMLVNLDLSYLFEFLYEEGILFKGATTRSYVLTRVITHVLSLFAFALLTSFVVEKENKTRRLLAEKATAFDRLDLLHRSIIESVDTGILTVNLEGYIRSFNRAAEEISGFTLGEVENCRMEKIFPGVSILLAQGATDQRKKQRRRFEIMVRKKSGESIVLGFSESPLSECGVRIGSILIFQDLTSFRKMEQEGEKNKQLAFIGQMAAGLAHELRTPLQSISGSIQLLRRDLNLDPTDERLMQVILRAKDQMESLVRNFLLMARPNPGKRSEVDVGQLIEDVIESLSVGADWNPRVELRKNLGQGLRVMGDPAEIRQILLNLIINAIQAMTEGGMLSVTACSDRMEGEVPAVRIEIGDTGCGIDPIDLGKIWEPFFTTKERGIGLGLAIVKRIVESHGGVVTAQSDALRGTCFSVKFPRLAVEESCGRQKSRRPVQHAAAGAGSG